MTINTLLIGAVGVVLSKYLNHKDIVIGMTTSGRGINLPGIEDMIGLFINTLPVRMDLSPKTTVLDYLAFLQKDIQELNEHGYVPLVDLLKWSSYGSDLFNVLFVYENYPIDESTYKESVIKVTKSKQIEKTEYPLSLIAHMMGNKYIDIILGIF